MTTETTATATFLLGSAFVAYTMYAATGLAGLLVFAVGYTVGLLAGVGLARGER